jgi:hypothetical protein
MSEVSDLFVDGRRVGVYGLGTVELVVPNGTGRDHDEVDVARQVEIADGG